MTLDVTFSVPMPPIGKGRPVFGHGHARTPAKTRRWADDFAYMASAYLPKGITGPVRVDVLAVLERPQALCRKTDPDGLMWAPVRPDIDNVYKQILDSLKAHWRDDAQVVCGEPLKVYAEKGGRARVVVRVSTPAADPMEDVRRLGLEGT